MFEWPDITILLVTYDRPAEIRKVIDGLRRHLIYRGRLLWHICDDGSPAGYVDAIRRDFQDLHFTATVTNRRGWGANVNTGMAATYSPYLFLCEDDYLAKQPLQLDWGVALMQALPAVTCVRYDGLSGHQLNLVLREKQTVLGTIQYLGLMGNSPLPHVYSNRPHLKSRAFHHAFGLYPEGLPLGETELKFAIHVGQQTGPERMVVALENGIQRAFEHIGVSRQMTALDVAAAR